MGLWCALKKLLFGSAGSRPAQPPRQPQSPEPHRAMVTGAVAYGIVQSQQSGKSGDPSAVAPAAMTAAVAAYSSLPPDQQTPERARELGVTFGMWNAINNSPPPAP